MTLERYRDLVFSPLALPSPPSVDIGQLLSWMTWARKDCRKRGLNASERTYEALTGRQYPWLMATAHIAGATRVDRAFKKEFPEVAEYGRKFPVKGVGWIVFLAQRGSAEVFLHTDSDGYWGFRFYLANANAESLHFCLARKRVSELPRRLEDWSPLLDVSRKHYARWPKENRPFCLNSIRSAHAVEANGCKLGDRVACLLYPIDGLDERRLLRLLHKSTEKYEDHQIWYKRLRHDRLPARPSTLRSDSRRPGAATR
jgi:hypothetical protein